MFRILRLWKIIFHRYIICYILASIPLSLLLGCCGIPHLDPFTIRQVEEMEKTKQKLGQAKFKLGVMSVRSSYDILPHPADSENITKQFLIDHFNKYNEGGKTIGAKLERRLEKMNDRLSVDDFLSLLQDSDWAVRWVAIGILPSFKDPKSIDPIVLALEDSHSYVRCGAAVALGQLNKHKSVEPLIKRMQKEFNLIKRTQINNDQDLLSVADIVGSLQVIIETLGKVGDIRAVEPIFEILKSGDWLFHYTAIVEVEAFERVHPSQRAPLPPSKFPYTIEVKHYEHKIVAASSLGVIGDKRAIPYLTEAINDKNQDVIFAVRKALDILQNK